MIGRSVPETGVWDERKIAGSSMTCGMNCDCHLALNGSVSIRTNPPKSNERVNQIFQRTCKTCFQQSLNQKIV